MKNLVLAGALLASTAIPAAATLQIAFTDGSSVVTCADGQACDLAGPINNIIILNETVGAFNIIGTVAASNSRVGDDNLQFSTSLIQNTGSTLGHLTAIVGDTNFIGPVNDVRESASLTFNQAVGSGASTLRFFADPGERPARRIGAQHPRPASVHHVRHSYDRPGQLLGHRKLALLCGRAVQHDGDSEPGPRGGIFDYGLQRFDGKLSHSRTKDLGYASLGLRRFGVPRRQARSQGSSRVAGVRTTA